MDLDELEQIYRAHHPFVGRMLSRMALPPGSVDDALQDVFLVAHRRIESFDGRTSIRKWLYGIARKIASEYRRGRRRGHRPLYLVSDPETLLSDGQSEGADHVEQADQADQRFDAATLVDQFLSQLDERKREVFLMAELEGMTAPEIAEVLGIKLNTVYSRMSAAREAFERLVARHDARQARERKCASANP